MPEVQSAPATKDDITEIKLLIGDFKTELKLEIAHMRTDMAQMKGDLKTEIAQMRGELTALISESKADMIKWMFIFWAGQMVITWGFVYLFIKHGA